jgi:hypothetical protein
MAIGFDVATFSMDGTREVFPITSDERLYALVVLEDHEDFLAREPFREQCACIHRIEGKL